MSSQPLTTTSLVNSMSPATSIWSTAVSPPASASSSLPFLLCSLFFFDFSASLLFVVSSFECQLPYVLCTLESYSPREYWSHWTSQQFSKFSTLSPTTHVSSFNFCTLIFISLVFSLLHLVSTFTSFYFFKNKKVVSTCTW